MSATEHLREKQLVHLHTVEMRERAFFLTFHRYGMDSPFGTPDCKWTFIFWGCRISWNPHDKVWELYKVHGYESNRDEDVELKHQSKVFSAVLMRVMTDGGKP